MNYKILPEITEKQKEIINLTYKFRFINRHQIQKLFGHKDPRRINTWLRDLVKKGYLGRIYSPRLLENTKPAIYYLANSGITSIRFEKGEVYGATDDKLEFKLIKKFYQDKHASETFQKHSIAICQFYLQLYEKGQKSKGKLDYEIDTKTEIAMYNRLYSEKNHQEDPVPDLFIEKLINPDKEMDSNTFLLELFDNHVPRYAMRYKIKQYVNFCQSDSWQTYAALNGAFPTVLIVVSNQQKINHLKKYIKKTIEDSYDSLNIRFVLTTFKKATEEGIGNNIWQEIT